MLKTDFDRENTGATFNNTSTLESEDKIETITQGQGDTRIIHPTEDNMSTTPKPVDLDLVRVETEDPRVKESWPFQQQQTSPGKDEKGPSFEEISDSDKVDLDSSGILQEPIEDDIDRYNEADVDEELYTGAGGGNEDDSKLNKTEKASKQKPFSFKNLHLPEIHLPRKFHRGAGNTHGQLVEEPCSPVNTLEREQVQFKESLEYHSNIKHSRSVSERAAESWRGFTSRARKHLHNLTTCSCVRNRDQAAIPVKYRKETKVELPPDINAVSNENAEV